jgi:hypothetical protein
MSYTLKKTKDIQGKSELLLVKLNKFYQDSKNKNDLIKILNGQTKISLRIIDWFVTNYSKKHFIEYIIQDKIKSPKRNTLKKTTINKISQKNNSKYTSSNRQFNVFLSYRSQLNAYSKKQFDPFCRRNRIDFYFNETQFVTTTVGQLNFFRWALSNNVIDYILKNYEEIEVDMNLNTKKNRIQNLNKEGEKPLDTLDIKNIVQSELKTKAKKERKKRQPLSVAATNNMNKNNNPVLVSFD